jgi:hypothetical protein
MNQIWLRHRNGGGKKYGNDCEVGPESYLDRLSRVGDSAEIYYSQIIDSLISDDALVSNAWIEKSSISGNVRVVGFPTSWPECLIVYNSRLSGATRIRDRAGVINVDLCGPVISGDARLIGPWSLNDCVRIHAGTWNQPPRWTLIDGENVDVVLSECVDDRYHLGCWCLPRETWFRDGYRQRLGKRSGWTPQQIEFAYDTFSQWATTSARLQSSAILQS